jgi:hypothetical protein
MESAQSYIKGLVKDRIDKAKKVLKEGVREVFAPPGKTPDTKKKDEREGPSKFQNIDMGTIKPSYRSKEGMVRSNAGGSSTQREYVGGKFKDLFTRARKNR